MNRNKFQFSLVFVAAAIIISSPLVASDDPNTIAENAIKEGVATASCANKRLLELSGLDYDGCLDKFERIAIGCWEVMQPLIPDLRFGQSNFDSEENQARLLATMIILEKCAQASILLGDTEEARNSQDE